MIKKEIKIGFDLKAKRELLYVERAKDCLLFLMFSPIKKLAYLLYIFL